MQRFLRLIVLIFAPAWVAAADLSLPLAQDEMIHPAGAGAKEPALFSVEGSDLLMSWLEPGDQGYNVRMSRYDGVRWSTPSTASGGDDLFINWADYPSIARVDDEVIAVHWLRTHTRGAYSYNVNIALSADEGRTWSPPLIPHDDVSAAQHGFASMIPVAGEGLAVVWLDGRASDNEPTDQDPLADAMQLRATFISPEGERSDDVAVDLSTCSCCQTAATTTEDGALLVAYRDRSADEIRDISLVRYADGAWSAPYPLSDDGWQIAGCPVNGPALASQGSDVVAAWFTAANDTPAVKVATSSDGGLTFGNAMRIDGGRAVGRVDATILDDGNALVSWLEHTDDGEALMVCVVTAQGCGAKTLVAENSAGGSMNFPALSAAFGGAYLAWTEPQADGSDNIRMVRLRFRGNAE